MKSMFVAGVALILAMGGRTAFSAENGAPALGSPVLVELFTSEGCSSCPPADALLQQLDRNQPVAGADIIVLSEHVDYWNSDLFKDPFSSSFYSQRQNAYSRHFDLETVYTPQAVIDGNAQTVGSRDGDVKRDIQKAAAIKKLPVRVSSVAFNHPGVATAHVEVDPQDTVTSKDAFVVVVLALNHAESHVSHGENGGRTLTHVAVVQSLNKVGDFHSGQAFAKDVELKFDPKIDASNLRVIAFVQQSGAGNSIGQVLGAAMARASGR